MQKKKRRRQKKYNYALKFNIQGHNTSKYQPFLTRGKLARVDNVCGFLLDLLVGLIERGTRKGHETSPSGFEDTKGADQFQERVDTGWLGGTAH